MDSERPTPPPIPRLGKQRERRATQELQTDELEVVVGVVAQARTLLRERIANQQFSSQTPDQLKLSVRIELGKIREGQPMVSYGDSVKIEEMMDDIIRREGISA